MSQDQKQDRSEFLISVPEFGVCAFCGSDCNLLSQICGNCSRYQSLRELRSSFFGDYSNTIELKMDWLTNFWQAEPENEPENEPNVAPVFRTELKCVPEHFKQIILAASKDDRTCSICMEEISDDIYATPCYHLFHLDCMKANSSFSSDCPVCRKKL